MRKFKLKKVNQFIIPHSLARYYEKEEGPSENDGATWSSLLHIIIPGCSLSFERVLKFILKGGVRRSSFEVHPEIVAVLSEPCLLCPAGRVYFM